MLCEKGRIAAEQSSRNWGWLRQQGRDLGELPIVIEAMRHWREFGDLLGIDRLGLRWTGILKLARTKGQLASFWPYMPTLRRDFGSTSFRPFAPKGFPDAWGTKRRWKAASPFEEMRILSPKPNQAILRRTAEAMGAAFPALKGLRIRQSWAGMIDTMPDVVPIVDEVPQIGGLILAAGMAGHGFGIGPGFGRVLADMAQGKPAGHDMSRFRFARFFDGSKIDFGAAL